MTQDIGKQFSALKNFTFWLIGILLTLAVNDLLMGGYLHWFEKPRDLVITKGLLVKATPPLAHPYKSYINGPGLRFWESIQSSKLSPTGSSLDYGVLEEGTLTNDFGHQVMPGDLDIINRPKQKNEFRILALGGSTTFQPWPHLLSQLLNQRSKTKEFVAINAGTGGYTSQENVVDLVTSGLSYRPDMIIAYLPVNDIYWAAYYPNFKRDYTHMRIPLKTIGDVNFSKPNFSLRQYPFSLKFYDWINYKKEIEEYKQAVDLKWYSTTGNINNGTMEMSQDNLDKTVDAVIENIQSMVALCEKRNIKFVLVTQKLFQTDNSFYTFMDSHVLNAINTIKKSKRLSGVSIIEMQNKLPDIWNADAMNKVKESFPDAKLNFDEGMAYDSMHFTPSALHLFATILADNLDYIVVK